VPSNRVAGMSRRADMGGGVNGAPVNAA